MREAIKRRLACRSAIAAAVAIASVLAFALLAGLAVADTTVSPTTSGKKVTICHKGRNTISISLRAWPAHQRHGDTLGACGAVQDTGSGTTATTTASTEAGTTQQVAHGNGKANGKGHG